MEQTVIKDEIEIHDDFICNTKVKQEFNDEMPSTAYQNVNTSSVHHIKEEISDDLETVREFEKSMVTIKKEESCNTFDKLSTQNKMEYMSIETRKPTKSQDRMDMEQTVIKDEIEIHDDFICNTKVKQEFNDEMPSAPFQNVNTSSMYHINEEISDDLETVREFEESMVTIKKEESCNTFDKLNIKNNFEYMRIKTGKSPKTQVERDAHVPIRCEMDDEELIELVRKYEFLYNLQHPKYTDSAKKEMAWKEISEELKQSAAACKQRWQGLRDAYRRAINKKKGESSGRAAKKIKKWKYEDELSFVASFLVAKKTVDSVDLSSDDEKSQEEVTEIQNPHDTEIRSENDSIVHNISSQPQQSEVKKAIKKAKQSASAVLMSRLLDEQKNVSRQCDHDELDRFFLSISATVKKFSPYLQAIAKNKTFGFVSEMELQQLAPPQYTDTPSPASSSSSVRTSATLIPTSPWNTAGNDWINRSENMFQ